MIVTPKQNLYLKEMSKYDVTSTKQLSESMRTTMATTDKMVRKLREKGLITSKNRIGRQGGALAHSLTKPYDTMIAEGLVIEGPSGEKVPKGEILYAAILRNDGLLGQRLKDRYHKVYPNRSSGGIESIIAKARKKGWCR